MDHFGAPIERGIIVSITEAGARVASTDRPGIVTMPLKAQFRKAMEVNWPVFFLEYEDGSGVVLCHQNPEVTRDDASQGEDGKSAYELWLEAGNTGTVEDFLESLIGPPGQDGQDGQDGGTGQDGQNGKSVTAAAFVENDLVFTLSDSSTITIAGAKILLTGPAGSNATVTKLAVEAVLTGNITTHTHNLYLAASAYTAADVLAKLQTVDGPGSGLDAATVGGKSASDLQKSNLQGSALGTSIAAGTTRYIGLGVGTSAWDTAIVTPFAGTLKNLYVITNGAPGAANARTFTVMIDNVPSAITCIMGSATNIATDTTHSANVTAGQRVSLRCELTSSSAAISTLLFALEFDS